MTEAIDRGGKPMPATPVARFLMAGAANTLLSILTYQAALFVTGHVMAYVVAYVAGVVFSYFVYARHVFHSALSMRRFVWFVLFYVASGCLGAVVNASLIEYVALQARVAIFITVIAMLPLNYFGSKWCLRGTRRQSP